MLQKPKPFKTSVKPLQTVEMGNRIANEWQATWYRQNYFIVLGFVLV